MDPIALQKQLRDNSSDLVDFLADLNQWGKEVKQKEIHSKSEKDSVNASSAKSPGKLKAENSEIRNTKRIKACDYSAWDKYDADAECNKVDDEKVDSSDSGELTDECDEAMHDEALYEKEKGNKFVKSGMWDKALECYTKAIELYAYDPVFYANRALCYLKKEDYRKAETDCTTALQFDKTYVKAYQRRAAAREALNQLTEAYDDLIKVFNYESNNKESRNALINLEKKLKSLKKDVLIEKPDSSHSKSKFSLSREQQKEQKMPTENKEHINSLESKSEQKPRPKSKFTLSRQLQKEQKASVENKKEAKSPALELEQNLTQEVTQAITYWPSGNGIELVKPIYKLPHLRSKKPLKKINICNKELEEIKPKLTVTKKCTQSWPNPENDSLLIKCNDLKVIERKIEDSKNTDITKEDKEEVNNIKVIIKEQESIRTKNEFTFAVPQTSVQFNYDWKLLKTRYDWKYNYLKQINPENFPTIFKESLDYDVFSDIISILAKEFIGKRVPVYNYLLGLAKVKRFTVLSMFMSAEDKKNLQKLMDYMLSNNETTSINSLMNSYNL